MSRAVLSSTVALLAAWNATVAVSFSVMVTAWLDWVPMEPVPTKFCKAKLTVSLFSTLLSSNGDSTAFMVAPLVEPIGKVSVWVPTAV